MLSASETLTETSFLRTPFMKHLKLLHHTANQSSVQSAPIIECRHCHKQIGIARYAQHLDGCMGITKRSTRSTRVCVANSRTILENSNVSDNSSDDDSY